MTYVAITTLVVALLQGIAWAGLVRWLLRGQARERQEWANERRELNDRLAHAAGHPWTPAPIRAVPEINEREERDLIADIEQHPDY